MSPTLGHTAIRAAILTAFRGLLRKCQITLSDSVLLRSDFSFFPWGMLLRLRKTKTIQFAERELLIPITYVKNTALCAVYWTQLHFSQAHVTSDAPAFHVPASGGRWTPLSYRALQATIKSLTQLAGFDPSEFSCHSLRRGGCTFLAIQRATIEEIRTRGDWKSDIVFKYIKRPLSERIVFDMCVANALDSS